MTLISDAHHDFPNPALHRRVLVLVHTWSRAGIPMSCVELAKPRAMVRVIPRLCKALSSHQVLAKLHSSQVSSDMGQKPNRQIKNQLKFSSEGLLRPEMLDSLEWSLHAHYHWILDQGSWRSCQLKNRFGLQHGHPPLTTLQVTCYL